MKTLLSTVALAAILCATAGSARAQDADDAEVTRMAKEHYKAGLDAYKSGKYDVAIKELKKAYLLKRLPALLLNIGATYRKMGDYDLALHFYQKYLDEAPADDKARPEVQSTIAEIQKEKAGGGAPAGGENAAVPPSTEPKHEEPAPRHEKTPDMPKEWSHSPIDAAPPETPIDVRVSMPVMKGVKVFAFYRTAGQAEFSQVLMKRHGTEKVGRIPAEAVQGKAIQYYVEARDASGAVVKSAGSPSDPNIIMIDASAKPQVVASLEASQGGGGESTGEEPKAAGHNLDDEAPMSGQLPKDKQPKATKRASSPSSSGSRSGGLGGLFWGGVIVGGIGVACIVVGAVGLAQAGSYSDTVAYSSQHPTDQNVMPIFFNNDPNANGAPQFAAQEAAGKAWNTAGIAMTTVGVIATVGGGIVAIVGYLGANKRVEQPRRVRPRVDEPVSNWFLTPSGGPKQAGVVAGFSF